MCVCCRREPGVFTDGDKSCQIFPVKLFLSFTPSTNREPTESLGGREEGGDRLLPRARPKQRLMSVYLLIFMCAHSCVVVYFYIRVSGCSPLSHALSYNTDH